MFLYLLPFLFLSTGITIALTIPNPPYIQGFDISERQAHYNPNFWLCTRNAGYQKVILEGFQEANKTVCGGFINDGFLNEYETARAVGYRVDQIDSYFFPCTNEKGPKPCNPMQQQLNTFTKFLDDNAIEVHTIWLDIEYTAENCDGWNIHDTNANFNLASSWVAAIKSDASTSGRKWGIYTSNTGGNWATLFGTTTRALAPDLPLWVVQASPSNSPSLSQYDPHIGGWSYATGKQWATETNSTGRIPAGKCGGSVDLDSFSISSVDQVANGPPNPPVQGYSCKTTDDGLRYRLCPHANASCTAIGQYPIGTLVEFKCKTSGDLITGDWTTDLWGLTTDGYYVSLAYIYQPCGNIIPECQV